MNRIQQFLSEKVLGIRPEIKAETQRPKKKIIPFTPQTAYGLPEPAPMDQMAQLNSYRSWVYACVNKIKDEMANLQLELYKRKNKGELKKQPTAEVLDLLDRVNNYMTRYDLFEYTSLVWELAGECFWWKIKGEGGKPISIYPYLLPSNMSVVPGDDTFVKSYVYRVPGTSQEITFDADEIIHFKYPNPINPYRGMSSVKGAEYAIATDNQASKWNWNFFKNSAKPYGIITYPGTMGEAQYKRIKAQWEAGHSGQENAHRLAILEGGKNGKGAEFKEIGFGQKDMDFIEQRKMSRDEIFLAFGIPKGIMLAEDVNKANAEVHSQIFIQNTIVPKYRKFVSYLNEFLLPDFDDKDEYFFDFVDPTMRDTELMLKYYESGLKNGWLSPNEVRELEGYSEFEGGEMLFAPVNMIPIGEAPESKKSITTNITRQRRTSQEVINDVLKKVKGKISDKLVTLSKTVFKDKITKDKKIKKKKKKKSKKKKSFFTKDQREKYAINHIKRADREEGLFRRSLSDYFRGQEKRVLPTLKSVKDIKSASVRFDIKAETQIAITMFSPIVEALIKEHGTDAMALLGVMPFDMSANEVAIYLEKEGLKFTNEINKVTKKKLAKAIAEGEEAGEDLTQISSRIRRIYSDARITRSNIIARTEVSRSSNFGTVEAYKQSDVVEAKEWLVTPDERLCDYCAPMDGKIVGLDSNYFDKGDSYEGNADRPMDLNYGDVEQPPLHASCRCTTIPVLK